MYQIHHKLKPGEVMTLDNWRVMHGRTEIKDNGGERALEVQPTTLSPFGMPPH